MTRVQPLATQQGADGVIIAAGLCLGQDRALVLSRELAPLGLFRNLRIRDVGRSGGAGVGNGGGVSVMLAQRAIAPRRICSKIGPEAGSSTARMIWC